MSRSQCLSQENWIKRVSSILLPYCCWNLQSFFQIISWKGNPSWEAPGSHSQRTSHFGGISIFTIFFCDGLERCLQYFPSSFTEHRNIHSKEASETTPIIMGSRERV